MATVLEECTIEEQRSLVRFLWTKGLNEKDIHKEISPAYSGKCLWRKAVHKCSINSLMDVRKSQMILLQVREWLRKQSKTSMLRVSAQ
jgi:hypothetical protein